MSGSVYKVKFGPPQQLTGAPLAKGATVYNTDLQKTVWISSDRNVQPNTGWPLSPQMAINWTGKQLFACLDAGLTSLDTVILDVSDDVVNVNNPVGIAEAIALLGVPNTYVSTQIINTLILAGTQASNIDVSQYASLILFMFATPSGAAKPLAAQIIQAFGIAGLFASDVIYPTSRDTSNNAFVVLEIPVKGKYLNIGNIHATSDMQVVVLGTNRPVNERKFMGFTRPPHNFALTAPVVASTFVDVPQVDLPGGFQIPGSFAANGTLFLSANANIAGGLYLRYLMPNGTENFLFIGTLGPTTTFLTYYQGMCNFMFVPSVNSANPGVNITLAPGPNVG